VPKFNGLTECSRARFLEVRFVLSDWVSIAIPYKARLSELIHARLQLQEQNPRVRRFEAKSLNIGHLTAGWIAGECARILASDGINDWGESRD
jgi:hypothetical protein